VINENQCASWPVDDQALAQHCALRVLLRIGLPRRDRQWSTTGTLGLIIDAAATRLHCSMVTFAHRWPSVLEAGAACFEIGLRPGRDDSL